MKTLINNANIVLPHSDTVLKDSSLVIENGLIRTINDGVKYRFDYSANVMVDAEGGYLIPGLINNHAHGFTFAPLNPSAGEPVTPELMIRNLNRHLLQGTTTLLSLDGFALPEEIELANKLHPVKIRTGATQTPLNFKAAEIADGAGLTDLHKSRTLKQMLDLGAVVIGEVGAGSTLGGGAASYLILPRAIEERTGILITPAQSTELIVAVLGRRIDPSLTDRNRLAIALERAGLSEALTLDEAIRTVIEAVFASVEVAREGIREATDQALEFEVPIIIHNAAGSKDEVLEAAERLGPQLIAAHSNHPSFDIDEMFQNTRTLKEMGAIIDISCGDACGAGQIYTPELIDQSLDLLCECGDVISTDFMGGNWDSMLIIIDRLVGEQRMSLPQAVALASYNVVQVLPRLAPNSGTIAVGKAADLAILDAEDLKRVKHVFMDGLHVVKDGNVTFPEPTWGW